MLSDTFTVGPGAVAQDLGGELVVLDMVTERYLTINPVGARIWELLVQGRDLDAVADALVSHYRVDRSQVEHDVNAFVGRLEALGLGSTCSTSGSTE